MFGMGMGELIIIAIVALLALGPEKLPEAAKKIGEAIRGLRRQTSELRKTIEDDTQLGDAMREIRTALSEDPTAPNKKKKPPRRPADGPPPDEAVPEEPLVKPADDAVATDDADAAPATVDDAPTVPVNGGTAPHNLSDYEKYIHENGTVAAAEKFGTSLEHAEEALETSLSHTTHNG